MAWTGRRLLISLWVVFAALSLPLPCFAADADPSWRLLATEACQREHCSGRLLIAIALHESGGETAAGKGDDGLSWGRWQIRITTAAGVLLGKRYRATERLSPEQRERIRTMLLDDRIAVVIGARILAECGRGNKRNWSRLKCWNKGDRYPGLVLPILRKLSGQK
jgi:hypothetical protein